MPQANGEGASHADYMADAIRAALLLMKEEWGVKLMASWAGCSTSEVYKWVAAEGWTMPRGDYLAALTWSAAKHGDYTLLRVQTPPGLRVCEVERSVEANGSTQDEVADATVALARAVQADGLSSRGVLEAADELELVVLRLRNEGLWLRGRQAQQPRRSFHRGQNGGN